MLVTIIRTGGFTGIPFKKTIDTSKLPADQAKDLEEKIHSSILTNQSSMNSASPDRFTYSLSIQNGEINQTVTLHEQDLDSQTKELISTLLKIV